MDTIIFLTCCAASGVLGHLRASTRAAADLARAKRRLSATLARLDEVERQAEFDRLTDVSRIDWASPSVEAGLDKLMAEIRATELDDRIAAANLTSEANRAAAMMRDIADEVARLNEIRPGTDEWLDVQRRYPRALHPSMLPPLPDLPELVIDLRDEPEGRAS